MQAASSVKVATFVPKIVKPSITRPHFLEVANELLDANQVIEVLLNVDGKTVAKFPHTIADMSNDGNCACVKVIVNVEEQVKPKPIEVAAAKTEEVAKPK